MELMSAKKVLMCPPTFFGIEYEINPWMYKGEHVAGQTAQSQWDALVSIYTEKLGWEVLTIEPVKHLPDMVFATDCCLMIDGKALLSSFRYPERQPETEQFERWFRDNGYTNLKKAANIFEGGGDMLIYGDKILAGYGFRSSIESHDEMREYFGREVVSLKLVDPFFYHMDTALTVLSSDTVAYYPKAFDEDSQKRIKAVVPNIIEATRAEAEGFGLNAVSDGKNVMTSDASPSLLGKYRSAGFTVHPTPILEFRKSGGGVKCLTLELRN